MYTNIKFLSLQKQIVFKRVCTLTSIWNHIQSSMNGFNSTMLLYQLTLELVLGFFGSSICMPEKQLCISHPELQRKRMKAI